MHEINVTPFVDVMLVLLIIFMVAAPLLTVGRAARAARDQGPAAADQQGAAHHQRAAGRQGLHPGDAGARSTRSPRKLKAIAKGGYDEPIFVRGDKGIDYGTVMRVMGRIKQGGFNKVSLVTEAEG